MIYAFVNDNVVKKVEEHESLDSIIDAHLFQIVIDVTSYSRTPKVGWAWEGGAVYNKLPNVTPRQVRQAMLIVGISMAQIEGAIGQLPEPQRSFALIEWEYSTTFIRHNPLVSAVGLMLGWNDDQLDDLWEMAGKL